MFSKVKLVLPVSFIALATVFSVNAFAIGAGGYRNEVVDAEAAGKGFSFVAQADNPSAVQYNPAGLTQLKGSNISVGYVLEAPRFSVDSNNAGNEVQMQKQLFYLPNVYFVTDLKSENLRFGFGANSPYGLSTDWANDSYARYLSTESNVKMMNYNPTVAYKVNDYVSVGAGLDFFTADVNKHRVVSTTLSDTGGDFQLKASDESWGYNFGLMVKPSEKHSIGLSYRSEIDLTLRGTVALDGLNLTGQAVFGGTSYSTAVESKSTIPRSVALGYAYKPNSKWTIEADVEWTDWSCVEEEFLTYPDETDATRLSTLNTDNPASRDWRSVFAYGIGAEYQATDKLELRGGLLYEESPIPSANFEPVLPDSDKYGVTTGFGYMLKNVKIDAAYAFLKYLDRDVTNDIGASTTSNVDGKYKGYVNIVALSLTYKY
jgi:long-chain fatty acid transport protein